MKPKSNFQFFVLATILAMALLLQLAPLHALAAVVNIRCPSGIENPDTTHLLTYCNFQELLVQIVQIFLEFAGAIAVIFLVIGGFQYIASRGNEEAMEKAKKSITAAVIGIVIIVMAYAIVAIINNLLVPPTP